VAVCTESSCILFEGGLFLDFEGYREPNLMSLIMESRDIRFFLGGSTDE